MAAPFSPIPIPWQRARILAAVLAAAVVWSAGNAAAAVEGYSTPMSVAPGDSITFMVSSTASYTVTYVRFRRNGDQDESIPLTTPFTRPAGTQTIPTNASETGCGWTPTFGLRVPLTWGSGIYAAECAIPGSTPFRITFVVRPPLTARADFAVLANTNTWSAYNDWGGEGKYTTPPAHYLSFLRPNPYAKPNGGGNSHLTRAELWVLDWLATSGYHCDVWSDWDFHRGIPNLDHYKALILNTHPEYWTREMLTALETYIAHGGYVLYLGGNGVYEETVFSADGNTLTFFPEYWCGDKSCRKYNYFRNLSPPRPERAILGVAYRSDCFETYAPFRILMASHRFFAGTGLVNGDSVGVSGLNGAASGWEMDTSIPGLAADGVIVSAYGTDDRGTPPANLQLLARGMNACGYGGDMTWYSTASGGGVFSAGSLTFGGSLVIDATLQKIVRNVLNEALQRTVLDVAGGDSHAGMTLAATANPFATATTLRFTLPRAGHVRLRIYDAAGRIERTLLDGAAGAGPGTAFWNGRDQAGRALSPGVYLARLDCAAGSVTRRLLLLK